MKKSESGFQHFRPFLLKRESRAASMRSLSQKMLLLEPRVDPTLASQMYLDASANRDSLPAVIDEYILREMGFKIGGIVRVRDFSTYKKATTRENVEVDVKITEKTQVPAEILKDTILNEQNLIRMIKNRNILEYIYGIETNFKVYLVYKSPVNGTLDEFLDENLVVKEAVGQKIIAGLIFALDYLHNELSVVHRNVAPWNIFLDEFFQAKLGNFELTLRMVRGRFIRTCSGSKHYTSPEAQRWELHDPFAADVWSVGAVFYEMLFGRPLLHDLKFQETIPRLSRSSLDRTNSDQSNLDARLSSRLSRLIRYDLLADLGAPQPGRSSRISKSTRTAIGQLSHSVPERRPTTKALVAQEWVRTADDIFQAPSFRKSSRLKSFRHSDPNASVLVQRSKK